jgi:hypothetical protein
VCVSTTSAGSKPCSSQLHSIICTTQLHCSLIVLCVSPLPMQALRNCIVLRRTNIRMHNTHFITHITLNALHNCIITHAHTHIHTHTPSSDSSKLADCSLPLCFEELAAESGLLLGAEPLPSRAAEKRLKVLALSLCLLSTLS